MNKYEGATVEYLYVNSKDKKRMIGRMITQGDTKWYVKDAKVSHIMRKNNSWGVNWNVIDGMSDTDYIGINCEGQKYYITVGKAKKCGEFLEFKTQGFEKQLFVPLENWERK
jgi:hypothetical protein